MAELFFKTLSKSVVYLKPTVVTDVAEWDGKSWNTNRILFMISGFFFAYFSLAFFL